MRIAESLNNTKKRMMDAFDRGDRATVAELTDWLAYMVMENVAVGNAHESILLAEITKGRENKKQIIANMMSKIIEELNAEKAKVMEGYEFEEDKE